MQLNEEINKETEMTEQGPHSSSQPENQAEQVDNSVRKPKHEGIAPADQTQFIEYRKRWVIVLLSIYATIVNGLANNNVVPVVTTISQVYDIPKSYASFPVYTTLIVYALANFPANYLIDLRGLRFSFIMGTGLYGVGLFLFVFIDKGYYYAVLGAIAIAIGQPFIINCPAKIATFWFLSENVQL